MVGSLDGKQMVCLTSFFWLYCYEDVTENKCKI